MNDIKILHNTRCSTSRKAMAILDEMKVNYDVILYLDKKWFQKEIKEILDKLGMKAEDIVRKKDAFFKENYAGKDLNNKEWIKAIAENPRLIERPIIIHKDKAIVARPIDRITDFLKG